MIASVHEIGCVLCEGASSTPVISDSGFTGRQCANCGLIFISPRPSRREIDEVYRRGDAHLSPAWFVQGREAIASRLRARRDAGLVHGHAAGGALLEIGPGRGTFLHAARRRGFDVFGVELNPTQASFIRSELGIPCAESLGSAQELAGGQFDVIYHRDVLSHFYDPHEEMERLQALLKPGGLHIFETGNLADVDHRYLKLIASFQYPDHLFFYGERSLGKLLDQTGYAHVHTHRWSVLPERRLRWCIGRARGLLSGARRRAASDPGAAPEATRPEPSGARSRSGRLARQALDLLYYAMQVSVGRFPFGDRAPQTLIVVARKSDAQQTGTRAMPASNEEPSASS
jgi:2-polyprenyl-3-methyl-5-hydroxy-6-metoxy-1,4-benzoquinol methylase